MYNRETDRNMRLFVLIFVIINEVTGLCYYDPANSTCCQGRVQPGAHMTCCGPKAFDYEKEVCCDYDNGTLLPIPHGMNYEWGCCKDKVYRHQDSVCCNNQIIEITNKNEPHWRYYSCCDGAMYNINQQICCEGTLTNRSNESQSCCGKKPYDYATDLCCEGNLFKRVNNTQSCCGAKIYNWNRQTCEYPEMKIRKRPSTGELCGKNVLIDYETERCCNGKYFIVSSQDIQCCNQQLYNTTNQVCCEYGAEVKIHNIVPHTPISCCRTAAYNYDTQFCCADQIVDITRGPNQNKLPCCRYS